jgi:hypothetical protein
MHCRQTHFMAQINAHLCKKPSNITTAYYKHFNTQSNTHTYLTTPGLLIGRQPLLVQQSHHRSECSMQACLRGAVQVLCLWSGAITVFLRMCHYYAECRPCANCSRAFWAKSGRRRRHSLRLGHIQATNACSHTHQYITQRWVGLHTRTRILTSVSPRDRLGRTGGLSGKPLRLRNPPYASHTLSRDEQGNMYFFFRISQ